MDLDRIAEEYARHKSSSSVFKEQHIKDFKAGYNKALEDSKAPEMLQMLIDLLDQNESLWGEYESRSYQIDEVKQLIKQATEL